jgi:aminobenzoyl-glutamate utilization protein A
MSNAERVDFRRDLHQHPEPAWCEYYTTARIVDALETRGIDRILVGPEILQSGRRGVPSTSTQQEWKEQALEAGAREDIVSRLTDGQTGAMAVIENGPGPTVALRVDIDGLPITEDTTDEHLPSTAGFRSTHEGYMHACGHDGHATIGIGVLDQLLQSEFDGTVKIIFQPGEEQIVGAEPIVHAGIIDDVDYLYATHLGLDHPTGTIVAGISEFLAVSQFETSFYGSAAHAGAHPESGENAVQALAAAVQNLYAIPRHSEGATRVNVGTVSGGTATNIIPESATISGEIRGETTQLMESTETQAHQIMESAARMHDCEMEIDTMGRAPSAESDSELIETVATVAGETAQVESVVRRDSLGGSEDATHMMRHVQQNGGKATYVAIGTDHPGGHHTPRFDIDEQSLEIGVAVLADAITKTLHEP